MKGLCVKISHHTYNGTPDVCRSIAPAEVNQFTYGILRFFESHKHGAMFIDQQFVDRISRDKVSSGHEMELIQRQIKLISAEYLRGHCSLIVCNHGSIMVNTGRRPVVAADYFGLCYIPCPVSKNFYFFRR